MRYKGDCGCLGRDQAQQCYLSWLEQPGLDETTRGELLEMEKDPARFRDHFGNELAFGTGGMRGVIGPGLNRINQYVVRRATQGLADLNADSRFNPKRDRFRTRRLKSGCPAQ